MEVNGDSTDATAVLNINYESSREAEIVQKILQVDAEPSRSKTKKVFSVSGRNLQIQVICPDVRELRISLDSLMDHLHLVNQTINKFGPPQPPVKKLCLKNQD
ncbi:UNVERIFIED_CONTAM: hypothetical protein RMT77_003091 [Armadillidium vulgare]